MKLKIFTMILTLGALMGICNNKFNAQQKPINQESLKNANANSQLKFKEIMFSVYKLNQESIATVKFYGNVKVFTLIKLLGLDVNNTKVLYNGMILSNSFSLNFYNIKDNDLVFVFDTRSLLGHDSKYLKEQCDFFYEKYKGISCNDFNVSVARLRDLELNRKEFRSRKFNRLLCDCNVDKKVMMNPLKVGDQKISLIVPPTPEAPSSEPLPIFWKKV